MIPLIEHFASERADHLRHAEEHLNGNQVPIAAVGATIARDLVGLQKAWQLHNQHEANMEATHHSDSRGPPQDHHTGAAEIALSALRKLLNVRRQC